jgi:hypothetical protein
MGDILLSGGMSSGTGGGDSTIVDGVDNSIKATVFDYTNSNPLAVITVDTNGNPTGGAAVSIADGADVAQGTTTDAAITTDSNGTVIGFLRGIVKILASVWDSINGRLKVDGSAVIQPVSGTVAVSGSVAVTGPLTDAQLRAADVKITLDGEVVPVTGTFFQATQPISAAALPLPTGASTEATQLLQATAAKQDTGNTSLASIDGKLTAPLSVTGPLTDTQLRATPVPVSGTVSVTEPVTVDAVDLDIRNLVFATDKVDVSGSSSVGVTGPLTDAQLRASAVPISAVTLPLPTGAATEVTQLLQATAAKQDTGNTSLASILTQLDVALSTRASQTTVASILAQLDVALSTRLSEATFTTRINTQGQKTSAVSTPVVLPSDQVDVFQSMLAVLTEIRTELRILTNVTYQGLAGSSVELKSFDFIQAREDDDFVKSNYGSN